MTTPHDDWDDEERAVIALFGEELSALVRRHASDPPLDLLAAARDRALPDEWQSRVDSALAEDNWARTLLEGAELNETPLDVVGQARIQAEVVRRLRPTTGSRRRPFLPMLVGGALAASALLAVFVLRLGHDPDIPEVPAAGSAARETAHSAPISTFLLPLDTPEIRLSLGALTWRGETTSDSYLDALKPAVDAYRAGDHAAASSAFESVATRHPNRPEALFYLGISRLHTGDAVAALTSLRAAAQLGDETFAEEATWYLAVAEQRAGNEDAARRRLDRQCAARGTGSTRACAALAQWPVNASDR